MFENNDMNKGFGENEQKSPLYGQEPPQQPAGGSYYSPRGGYPAGGGFIPPSGNYNVPNGSDEPPQKKPHKGLKALAVFAGIAFLSYASIQCYQFAVENDSIRSFLGKESSVAEEQDSMISTAKAEDSTPETKTEASTKTTDNAAGEPMSFIELAARENAMSLPDIVDKVTPATVGVSSTFIYEGTDYSSMFGFGFGQPQRVQQEMPATGTGIIM